MAGAGERTEKATPRRRSKARQEGQVAKSSDLNAGLILAVAFAVLFMLGSGFMEALKGITIENLSKPDIASITVTGLHSFLFHYIIKVTILMAPVFGALMIFGVIINVAQVGPLFTTKPVVPNLNKINPISGFKRIFSMRGLVELLKGILKMLIVGGVAFYTIWEAQNDFYKLANIELLSAMAIIYNLILTICLRVCIILVILGISDYIYQRYEFEKSIKMTKQEIKDEMKNTEGNPQIKRKIRTIQMQMSQSRMMSKVKDADVIVTNPTHYAIALKYNQNIAPAPIVIAKGMNLIAKRIKELGREHKIPIVENKPLARSLYKLVDLNHMVPEELFVAVAEVLAYIYKKNKKKQTRSKPR